MKWFRVPAKIIIVGEHFVVKGVPAIAAAITLYAYTSWERIDKPVVTLDNGIDHVEIYPTSSRKEYSGFTRIAEVLKPSNVKVILRSSIPQAAGLGSSAATSAAVAAALLDSRGIAPSKDLVWKLAFEAEKVFHGKPSGIDNTVCVYGGIIIFHSRGIFEKLNVRLKDATIVVALTHASRSTREAVERVLKLRYKYAKAAQMLYHSAHYIIEDAYKAIIRNDLVTLGEIMNYTHGLLYALGISTPEIEKLVWAARKAGAYGAKLTGAGLGGAIIALTDNTKAHKVKKELIKAGAKQVYRVQIDTEGLTSVQKPIL